MRRPAERAPARDCISAERREVPGRRNYADLPLWDMLAGASKNPTSYIGECGFESPSDRRMGAMLAFKDVNHGTYGPASKGGQATPDGRA